MFVENTNIPSTNLEDVEIENGQKPNHHFASEYISNWWEENQADIQTIMNISTDPLIAYAYDTENANTPAQQSLIKGLGAIGNQNTNNKTWNDESPANVFISKAKLN